MMEQHHAGFSLVELLVVMTILGLALTVIPPMFDGVIESSQVKSATRELAAALRQTRSIAVTSQREAVLGLDVNDRSYSINDREKQLSLPEEIRIRLRTAESELSSESRGHIRFFPDGSATGGYIALESDTADYRIDVDWLTGRISITP